MQMKTLTWYEFWHRCGTLDKPVGVKRGWYRYTAIPLDLVDWVRPMLLGKGLKVKTYYIGPANTNKRRSEAWFAKILCEDPRTGERNYL